MDHVLKETNICHYLISIPVGKKWAGKSGIRRKSIPNKRLDNKDNNCSSDRLIYGTCIGF